MNIIVIVKATFDVEEKVVIEKGQIVEDGIEFIINPYDEYALEEAIRLKEEAGGEVTVVTVGSDHSEKILRTAYAFGADRAVLIEDDLEEKDEFITSKLLASFIKDNSFDIIFAGNMSIDNGTGQIGPRLAEELEIPYTTAVTKVVIEGDSVVVNRDVEGDTAVLEFSMPLLITAQQGLNEPRYPSFPSIMKAKKKPIERIQISDLGISDVKAKTKIVDQFLPAVKEKGRILEGAIDSQVLEIVQLINKDHKIV
ncbi:electron transfer flavoprotein subunit beta/FixA family protein [Niallia sp. 01092]|uniref:electron transfer flavoprotein subunit beta/FixA family protein n=1 Tax=unclassified Niallia TaxID=2837522 RepID=UPI003FD2CFEA